MRLHSPGTISLALRRPQFATSALQLDVSLIASGDDRLAREPALLHRFDHTTLDAPSQPGELGFSVTNGLLELFIVGH